MANTSIAAYSLAQGSSWTNYPNFIGHYQDPNNNNTQSKQSARTAGISLTNCTSLSFTLNYKILPQANARLPIIIQLDTNTTMPIYVLYHTYYYLNNGTITEGTAQVKRLYQCSSTSQTATSDSALTTVVSDFSSYWNAGVKSGCSYDGTNKSYTFTPGTTRIAFYPYANSVNGSSTYSGTINSKSCTITLNFPSAITGTYYLKFITPKIWLYNGYSGGVSGNLIAGSAIELGATSYSATIPYEPTVSTVTLTYNRGVFATSMKKNGTGTSFSVPDSVSTAVGSSITLAANQGTFWTPPTVSTYTLTPASATGVTFEDSPGSAVRTSGYTPQQHIGWTIGTTTYAGGASYTISSNVVATALASAGTAVSTANKNTFPTATKAATTTTTTGSKVTFNKNGGGTITPTSATSTNTITTRYSFSKWTLSGSTSALTATSAISTSTTIYANFTSSASTTYGSITLASGTRTGYTLLGWSTNSAATTVPTSMKPGKSYTPSAAITLYAIWTSQKGLSYDDGETWGYTAGNIPADYTTTTAGTLTTAISSNTPTLPWHTFAYWSGSNGSTYSPGASVSITTAGYTLTLTAIWTAKQKVNVGGTLKDIHAVYANVNGTIKLCTAGYVNVSNTIKTLS